MDAGLIVALVGSLVAAWALLLAVMLVIRPRDVAVRELVRLVPDVIRLGRDLLADPSTPLGVRVALVALLAWLLSPIDLVPEFIPILGPLDDVIVAVVVLRYVRRRVGADAFRRRWRGSDGGFELLGRVLGGR